MLIKIKLASQINCLLSEQTAVPREDFSEELFSNRETWTQLSLASGCPVFHLASLMSSFMFFQHHSNVPEQFLFVPLVQNVLFNAQSYPRQINQNARSVYYGFDKLAFGYLSTISVKQSRKSSLSTLKSRALIEQQNLCASSQDNYFFF